MADSPLLDLLQFGVCHRCAMFYCLAIGSTGQNSVTAEFLSKMKYSDKECTDFVMKTLPEKNTCNTHDQHKICPNCYNCFNSNALEELAASVLSTVGSRIANNNCGSDWSIYIHVTLPPILDALRVAIRNVMITAPSSSVKFPLLEDLIRLQLSTICSKGESKLKFANDEKLASFKLEITGHMENETALATAIYPSFQHRNNKRKRGHSESAATHSTLEKYEVTQSDTCAILQLLKSADLSRSNLIDQWGPHFNCLTHERDTLRWQMQFYRYPCYLLGRYRKLARDVPQAPWTVENNERKGRNSVEEIIGDAVVHVLQAVHCRLHGCGREDIDVRCLGNGRPFVLEVTHAVEETSQENLNRILSSIGSKARLNAAGDIEVLHLQATDKSTWETMQAVAEEKKKGYCCLVWSKNEVTRESLLQIEEMSGCQQGVAVNEEGRRCLALAQKTPLRVLHRRSQLVRMKHIYDIETAILSNHYFIMRLVTAPGTYVKEFVHGDLGRTSPSISSLLGCQAEILQLDVVKLFDGFTGGAAHAAKDEPAATAAAVAGLGEFSYHERGTAVASSGFNEKTLSWDDLKCMKVANNTVHSLLNTLS